MEFKEALDALVSQIKAMVEKMLIKAEFDKTYTGIISEKTSKEGSSVYIYKVNINDKPKTIKSYFEFNVGDYVSILIPRNNWNNAKIVYSEEVAKQISELRVELARLTNR